MQNVVKTNHRPIAKVGDDSYTFIVQRTRATEILRKQFSYFFFFFLARMNRECIWIHHAGNKVHCSHTVYVLFIDLMSLFTYLKITPSVPFFWSSIPF